MARKTLEFFPGGQVPKPNSALKGTGRYYLAIWAEGEGKTQISAYSSNFLLLLPIPQLDRSVVFVDDKQIRTKAYPAAPATRVIKPSNLLPTRGVPHMDGTTCQNSQKLPVLAERCPDPIRG